MENFLSLAERCEKASGPDRDLDLAIRRQIDPEHVAFMDADLAKGMAELIGQGGDAWEKRKDALFRSCNRSPHYTSSLDAAMTLVPEGHQTWTVAAVAYSRPTAIILSEDDRVDDFRAYAATPALAMCAASLRARAASVDTLPKGGNGAAGSVRSKGSAVPEGETP